MSPQRAGLAGDLIVDRTRARRLVAHAAGPVIVGFRPAGESGTALELRGDGWIAFLMPLHADTFTAEVLARMPRLSTGDAKPREATP